MTLFSIKAEVVDGARDTGRFLETLVLAKDRLDAAINGERQLDKLLPDKATQWTHAVTIEPVSARVSAMALAA